MEKLMEDIYNKPDKAGRRQQINSRLTLLGAEKRRLAKEQVAVDADIEILRKELREEIKAPTTKYIVPKVASSFFTNKEEDSYVTD
jgi:hypothetical protein